MDRRTSLFVTALLCCHSAIVSAFVATPRTFSSAQSVAAPPLLAMAATLEPAVNGSADSGATTNDAPPTIRLNIHEKARTVTSVCTSGTLCTISSEPTIDGSPFGSFVDYVLDDTGNPILLMNEMSMHTINIQNNPQVTLFTQLGNEGQDVSRCSVAGKLVKLRTDDEQMDTIRMRYSIAHAYADQVMDSPKFAFYRLEPSKIYFVGGFGVSSQWIDPQEYYAAHPDILAKSSSDILSNLNKSHQDDLKNTARYLLQIDNVESVRVTSVDRLGMDVRVTFEAGSRRSKLQTDEFRVGFRIPVLSVEDAKSEVYKVFQEAWEVSQDVSWGADDAPGVAIPIEKIAADSLE